MKKLSFIILLCGLLVFMASCSPSGVEEPVDAGGGAGTDETAAAGTDEKDAAGTDGTVAAGTDEKDASDTDSNSVAKAQDVSSPALKLTMSVKEGSLSPSGATLVFTNDSNVELDTGTYFLLEKFDGHKWTEMNTIIENYAWPDVGIILPPGQDTERVEKWEWLYGKLSPGIYRINKDYDYQSDGYDNYPISAEFEIV
jgi:hypothetical protein